jgi:hypothetical protein
MYRRGVGDLKRDSKVHSVTSSYVASHHHT